VSAATELRRHPSKVRTLCYGAVATLIGLAVDNPYAFAAGLAIIGFGLVQLVQYWRTGGLRENDCHVCGQRTETGLVTCEACRDIVPEKAFVLECEWCEKCWYSNSRLWNTFRSLIHSRREHPDEMESKYGIGEDGGSDA
jgi:hypothetical protein